VQKSADIRKNPDLQVKFKAANAISVCMKHVIALSVSMVAVSAGAGFGLSALHDLSEPPATLARALPEAAGQEFSAPAFIPDTTAVITERALAPTAPALPEPVRVAALPSVSAPALPLQRPRNRDDEPTFLAARATVDTEALTPAISPLSFSKAENSLISVSHRAHQPVPVFVQQAPDPKAHLRASDRPDYIIGMFR
jgi:hypothetical protein